MVGKWARAAGFGWWPAMVLAVGFGLAAPSAVAGQGSIPETLRQSMTAAACDFVEGAVTAPHDSLAVAVDLPMLPDKGGGIADYRFDLLSSRSPAGTVGLRLTLFFKDGSTLPLTATARVRVYDRVCIAARRIDRHESLAEEDLRLERCDVTSLADGYYSDIEKIVGKRTRRIMSVGSIVQASDVEGIPLVVRGSGVVVSVVIGPVTVVSKGKALEDGDLGQIITVEHLVTRRRLTGTVMGRGLVVLQG